MQSNNIESFLKRYPNARWGPAHTVLSDKNVENANITYCLDIIQAMLTNDHSSLSKEQQEVAKNLLSPESLWAQEHASHGWDLTGIFSWDERREELTETATFLQKLLTILEDERE